MGNVVTSRSRGRDGPSRLTGESPCVTSSCWSNEILSANSSLISTKSPDWTFLTNFSGKGAAAGESIKPPLPSRGIAGPDVCGPSCGPRVEFV